MTITIGLMYEGTEMQIKINCLDNRKIGINFYNVNCNYIFEMKTI